VVHLLLLRGGFWRADQQLDEAGPALEHWPDIAVLIATRNDAGAIEDTLPDLLGQHYPGRFHVFLVDDNSRDGTVEAVQETVQRLGAADRLSIATVGKPPAGWSRKAWALSQVHDYAAANLPAARYVWLSEPWAQHEPYTLENLVTKAEEDHCDLVSILPYSSGTTVLDRILSPAFAFFFQAFHPPRRVNNPKSATAAAAPGCLLVEANALRSAGGFTAVKNAPALESALAAAVKASARKIDHGIWLGVGEYATTVRADDAWRFHRRLVYLTAATKLCASTLRLGGWTVALALACLVPPVVGLCALAAGVFLDIDQFLVTYMALLMACLAWAGISFAAWPTYRLYDQQEWDTLLMPLAALAYVLLTLALLPKLLGARLRYSGKPAAEPAGTAVPASGGAKVEPRF
jgi:hopene-associated glycosyltransferase HpnB